jgi:uncharacterized SAM-binding protein YcdF (DUF218 family)
MYLFVKDFIVALFAPTALVGLCFALALLGLRLKRERIAKGLACAGLALFTLFSLNPLTEALLHLYEGQYTTLDVGQLTPEARAKIKFVVVLGGGYTRASKQPLASQLGAFTLPRVVEGVRLWHALPHTKLVLSGKGWETITEAEAMANMAQSLGVPRAQMLLDPESSNTAQHPVKLAPLLLKDTFVLVTSAIHMPRAIQNFKRSGLVPVPAPVGHVLTGDYNFWNTKPPYPRGDNLAAMDVLYYEWVGMLWNKLRGSP